MKIAIQLYGHLRTFEKCAPALKKHILDHYDCDIFIHTWSKTEHDTKSWYNDSIKCFVRSVDNTILEIIEKLYAPKAIKIETQNLFDEQGSFGTHDQIKINLQGIKYMVYSQYQANKLREIYETENRIKYDYVIVMRPDIMPLLKLELNQYQQEFNYFSQVSIHFIHNSENNFLSNKVINYPRGADCFYFSTPDVITQITQSYEKFYFYYKKINQILPKQMDVPEVAFFEAIHQKGILTRQYMNDFVIKRYNDKDDAKPKITISENNKLYTKVNFKKVIFNFILNYFPSFVSVWVIKTLKLFLNK